MPPIVNSSNETQPESQFEKINEKLFEILAHLTCPICDTILVSPVALQCNHRFCECCVKSKRKNGIISCPSCKKPIENRKFKNQTNLKIYLDKFMLMMEQLRKENKSHGFTILYTFVKTNETFSSMKRKFEKESKKASSLPDVKANGVFDSTIAYDDFSPSLSSTVLGPCNNKKSEYNPFIKMNGTVFITPQNNLDETMEKTCVSDSSYEDETEPNGVHEINETVILESPIATDESQVISSDESQSSASCPDDETIIESRLVKVENDYDLRDDISEVPDSCPDRYPSGSGDTYQTQSQYPVKKECISYSHKTLDKFDQVVMSTEKSANGNLTRNGTFLSNESETEASSSERSRCKSPELDMSNFESDSSFSDFN